MKQNAHAHLNLDQHAKKKHTAIYHSESFQDSGHMKDTKV
jgi:hypothetical protein